MKPFDGRFDGKFGERSGRWLVEYCVDRSDVSSWWLEALKDHLGKFGAANFDAVLLTIPDRADNRPKLLAHWHARF